MNEDGIEVVVNKFVRDLMDTIDVAAKDVYGSDYYIRPPVKFPTPYGGRLMWTLPGKTLMVVHLKNKDKIRHKKRWSQVRQTHFFLCRLKHFSVSACIRIPHHPSQTTL
jgi:chitin synthase